MTITSQGIEITVTNSAQVAVIVPFPCTSVILQQLDTPLVPFNVFDASHAALASPGAGAQYNFSPMAGTAYIPGQIVGYVKLVNPGTQVFSVRPGTETSLPPFTGDSGSGGSAGVVPAPAAGDAAAGKFLKADGGWVVPSGGGGGTPGGAVGTLQWNNAGSFDGIPGSNTDATGQITVVANSPNTDTSSVIGALIDGLSNANADGGYATGAEIYGANETAHNATLIIGMTIFALADDGGGTADDAVGLEIVSGAVSGGTTNTAIRIGNVAGGTANYAIKTGAGLVSIGDNITIPDDTIDIGYLGVAGQYGFIVGGGAGDIPTRIGAISFGAADGVVVIDIAGTSAAVSVADAIGNNTTLIPTGLQSYSSTVIVINGNWWVDTSGNVNQKGTLQFDGATSGSAAIGVAAIAGTPQPWLMPTATATAGYLLSSDGGSPQQLSWVAPGGGGGSIGGTTTSAFIPYSSAGDTLSDTSFAATTDVAIGDQISATTGFSSITIGSLFSAAWTGIVVGAIGAQSIGLIDTAGGCAVSVASATNKGVVITSVGSIQFLGATSGIATFQVSATGAILTLTGGLGISGSIGFFGTTPAVEQTVAGIKVDAVAASILAALVAYGMVIDTTT